MSRIRLFVAAAVVATFGGQMAFADWVDDVTATNPFAWYRFEESDISDGAQALDSSGNDRHGTYVGFAQPAASAIDGSSQAFSADGAAFVDLGESSISDFSFQDSFTIAAWVQVDTLTKDWQAITAKGDNSWRMHRNGSSTSPAFGTSGLSDPADTIAMENVDIGDGNWHMVVGVADKTGGVKTLYMDGDNNFEVTQDIVGDLGGANGFRAYIGENSQNTGRHWDGLIDEVVYWDRALTSQEVFDLYNAGSNSTFPLAGSDIPPDFTGDPVGEQPAPEPGFWSVREWQQEAEDVNGVAGADAVIANPDYQFTRFVTDAQAEIINYADPGGAGGGYSVNIPKSDFPSARAGAQDDTVIRAIATLHIEEAGDYTFGIDGDDGARLTIDGASFTGSPNNGAGIVVNGDNFGHPENTGNAFGLASTFLDAGEHRIELVWQERGGGSFVEVFAAEGVKADLDDDFAPVGLREPFPIASGAIPEMAGDFTVTGYANCSVAPNSITTANDCVAEQAGSFNEFPATATVINFNDAEGDAGFIGGDGPFPQSDLGGPTDNHVMEFEGTVVIPVDGTYTFGFRGDDGSALTLEGANFTIENPGGPRELLDDGQTIAYNGNTGNSETYASAELTAGEYNISGIWWEAGGGANFEVFAGPGAQSGFNNIAMRLLGSPGETLDVVVPAGLSIGTPTTGGTCGDFDMDGDVDAADRTIQTVGWTGAIGDGSGTATFADGDCDGDGDVDTADQTGLIGNWTGALGGMAGNLTDGDDADLVYDPANGNVTIDASDTAAGQIISFVIGTDQNNMDTSATVVPFIDAGTNTDNTPFQIGQTDPLNQGAGPLVDIGNVLPTGMDLTALSEYLTIAEYASELGAGGTLDLRVVPEPSGLVLALFGLFGLATRRRRK